MKPSGPASQPASQPPAPAPVPRGRRTCHREHASDDRAHRCEEAVELLGLLGHHDLDGRHLVSELGAGVVLCSSTGRYRGSTGAVQGRCMRWAGSPRLQVGCVQLQVWAAQQRPPDHSHARHSSVTCPPAHLPTSPSSRTHPPTCIVLVALHGVLVSIKLQLGPLARLNGGQHNLQRGQGRSRAGGAGRAGG